MAEIIVNETPKHVVIWFDQYIGRINEYNSLKNQFSNITDPRININSKLSGRNFKNLEIIDSKDVIFMVFIDVDKFLDYIKTIQKKRLFLIISETAAQHILSILHHSYQEILFDPVSRKSCQTIYILRDWSNESIEWMRIFSEYIHIFEHELDLLSRVTHDIVEYYVEESKNSLSNGATKDAWIFANWANALFLQYIKIGNSPGTIMKKYIQQQKENTENILIHDILPPDIVPIFYDVKIGVSTSFSIDSSLVSVVEGHYDRTFIESKLQCSNKPFYFIASKTLISNTLLSSLKLIRYYLLGNSDNDREFEDNGKVRYVYSIDHLFHELLIDVSEYYEKIIPNDLCNYEDVLKAKYCISKSKECLEILINENTKRLSQYASDHH